MSAADRFVDTNVLLNLLSADTAKADRAGQVLAAGGVVSVQVLNEFAAVATRELGMSIAEVREALAATRAVCAVVPVSEQTHDKALDLVARYGLSFDDALIAAAALLAGCTQLLTEDLHAGRILDQRLTLS